MRLAVLPQAATGTGRIRFDQALAVSRDLKRFPIEKAETVVKIRPK